VSDSHEPSYYEIALTNRQVVVAFVILLVCLIASFFSGVWVGRESGYRSAEQMVRAAPPAEEEEKEGQNLEEFEFFDSEQQAAATTTAPPEEPEPEPEPETEDSTLTEELGVEENEPQVAERQPQPAPPAEEEMTPRERREARRREREAAAAAAATTPPAPQPARTERPAPAEPARSAGQVVIQVFSSPEKDQAERIRTRLTGGGHRAYLSPVEVSGRTMYRVRIGPFDSRGDAQKVAEQVRKGYKLDTWVTE
jgi:DedD protein